ncbi:MAG: hypothetical protein ABIA21_00870 [Candidatus Aenigmatarchaeota archaeon]
MNIRRNFRTDDYQCKITGRLCIYDIACHGCGISMGYRLAEIERDPDILGDDKIFRQNLIANTTFY